MKKRVCVLQSSYEGSLGTLSEVDPYRHVQAYDPDGKYEWTDVHIKKATALHQVRELVQSKKYDVFLNLCDGAFDEDRAGMEVVHALEKLNCAYTGANAVFYEPSKELMKKMAFYYGIDTPAWAFIFDIDMHDDAVATRQAVDAVQGLTYPLIVKHYNGYSSVGMGKDCKVHDTQQLVTQVRKVLAHYGGALIEEFIPGREFTVLVAENPKDQDKPIALLPVECKFGPGEDFKHFDLKWKEYDSMHWDPLDTRKEPQLNKQLTQAAAAAFVALKGCSYGRCDFRVDHAGRVHFLEINPNCGLFYAPHEMGSADIILTMDPKFNHLTFIDHLLECALARQERKNASKKTEIKYRHGHGFGLFANRDIHAGETVISYEERPHVLVTRRHAARVFGEDAVPTPCKGGSAHVLTLPVRAVCGLMRSACRTLSNASGNKRCSSVAGDTSNTSNSQQQQKGKQQGSDIEQAHASHSIKQQSQADGDDDASQSQLASGSDHDDAGMDFHKLRGQWFKAYAYPITDETWVTWSDDPEQWLPLNHSCDPNTWLEGLDLVARRGVKQGEQITADYATFCVYNMADFDCKCGSDKCRGRVTGRDYLAPWIDKVYGSHVSDYVGANRSEAKKIRRGHITGIILGAAAAAMVVARR